MVWLRAEMDDQDKSIVSVIGALLAGSMRLEYALMQHDTARTPIRSDTYIYLVVFEVL